MKTETSRKPLPMDAGLAEVLMQWRSACAYNQPENFICASLEMNGKQLLWPNAADNITQEAAYLRAEGRASFERPYGLAWLLQLVAELREWDDLQAREMAANLRPLEDAALERLNGWLPKLSDPVRIGEHDQTAFALGLMLDCARASGNTKFTDPNRRATVSS